MLRNGLDFNASPWLTDRWQRFVLRRQRPETFFSGPISAPATFAKL